MLLVDRSSLVASKNIDDLELTRLIATIKEERCDHSWANYNGPKTIKSLTSWENDLRETEVYFYYCDGELVGSATVAERINTRYEHNGFPVLGRCFITKQFRRQGFYRQIFKHRVQHCMKRFGGELKAIHIGTSNDRVRRVISSENRKLGVLRKLGNEALALDGSEKIVGAYVFLFRTYLDQLISDIQDIGQCSETRALISYLKGQGELDSHCIAELLQNVVDRQFSNLHLSIKCLDDLCRSIPVLESKLCEPVCQM